MTDDTLFAAHQSASRHRANLRILSSAWRPSHGGGLRPCPGTLRSQIPRWEPHRSHGYSVFLGRRPGPPGRHGLYPLDRRSFRPRALAANRCFLQSVAEPAGEPHCGQLPIACCLSCQRRCLESGSASPVCSTKVSTSSLRRFVIELRSVGISSASLNHLRFQTVRLERDRSFLSSVCQTLFLA
jgi:hypothetical protein